jgi:hypothetical protein
MMSTVLSENELPYPYKPTHKNHPCTKWVGESLENYCWLYDLTRALNREFKFRFKGVDHLSWTKIVYLDLPDIPSKGLTTFAQAMPDQYRDPDVVKAYRNYYQGEKAYFAQWTKRDSPYWWNK